MKELQEEVDQLADISDDQANVDLKTFKSTIGVKREDTIHVSGLPYHFKDEELRLLFKDCGKVVRIAIPEDRFSN